MSSSPRISENFVDRSSLAKAIQNENKNNEKNQNDENENYNPYDNYESFEKTVLNLKKIEASNILLPEHEDDELKRQRDEISFLQKELIKEIPSDSNKQKINETMLDLDQLLNTGLNIIEESKLQIQPNQTPNTNPVHIEQENQEQNDLNHKSLNSITHSILRSKTPTKIKHSSHKNVSFDSKTTDFRRLLHNQKKLRSPPLQRDLSSSPKLKKMNISSGKKAFIDTCKNYFRTSIPKSNLTVLERTKVNNTLKTILNKIDYSNLDKEEIKKIHIEQEEQIYGNKLKEKVDLSLYKDMLTLKIQPKKDIFNENMSLTEKINYLRTKKNEILKQIILDKIKINFYFR